MAIDLFRRLNQPHMKLVALLLLMSIITLGALVEVRDDLGFPIPNATVCAPSGCFQTNATGAAETPLGVAVEIYVKGVLVWRTYTTGHDVVTVRYLEALPIQPVEASGYVVVKMVKLINGTYRDVKVEFRKNNLSEPLPVGGINYQLEIYITEVGDYKLPNATLIKTDLWDPAVDLETVGLVKTCQITLAPPIAAVVIYADGRVAAVGSGDLTFYLVTGLSYRATADTEILLPNGTRYRTAFQPRSYCGRLYAVNATKLTIRAVDSFGVVRNDWAIKIAGNTYRGQAELWVLPGEVYRMEVDAGFARREAAVATKYPSETLIVAIENAYLVLNYRQPPAKVYILGNYSVVDRMPRRVELPPGQYTVVADMGGRNVTYTVTLKPGQVTQLTVEPPATAATTTAAPPQGMTHVFVGVTAVIIATAALLALRATRRRPPQAHAQSRS
jgi:hypothetical protein